MTSAGTASDGRHGRRGVHVELDVADTAQLLKVEVEDVAVDAVHVGAGELRGGKLVVLSQ
jgi:hypothetical protein